MEIITYVFKVNIPGLSEFLAWEDAYNVTDAAASLIPKLYDEFEDDITIKLFDYVVRKVTPNV